MSKTTRHSYKNLAERMDEQAAYPDYIIAREMKRCSQSFEYWLDNYAVILTEDAGLVPLELWPKQREIIQAFIIKSLLAILKGRQLGISWLTALYALWFIIFHPFKRVGTAAFNEDRAQEFMDYIFFAWDSLPNWMKPEVLSRSTGLLHLGYKQKDENEQIKLRGRLSWVKAYPCTTKFLRGIMPSVIILDEADWIDDLDQMAASIWGSRAQSNAQLIAVSTANGAHINGEFYRMFWEAGHKDKQYGSFHAIFAGRDTDPRRVSRIIDGESWEIYHRRLMGAKFRQEHPATPQEAWLVNSRCFFDAEELDRRIQHKLKNPTPPQFRGEITYNPATGDSPFQLTESPDGCLKIWKNCVQGHNYVIGADPAGGGKQGNNAVAYVLDGGTMEYVALVCGKIAPDDFAYILQALGYYYNVAFIGVEANQGDTVNRYLTNPELAYYPNVFMREPVDELAPSPSTKLGWYSVVQTKKVIYDQFNILWSHGRLIIYDIDLLYEMQNVLALTNIRIGTSGNRPDDRPDAACIALHMHSVGPPDISALQRETEAQIKYRMALKQQEEMLARGVVTIMRKNFSEDGFLTNEWS